MDIGGNCPRIATSLFSSSRAEDEGHYEKELEIVSLFHYLQKSSGHVAVSQSL